MKVHCCERMKDAVTFACDLHKDEFECPDSLIRYNEKHDDYGLIIHDGGSSCILINYCPYCGHELAVPGS